MSTDVSTRRDIAAYAPASREALVAQGIGCILGGRPYPETLRAPSYRCPSPASAEEGLRWLTSDPRPVRAPS